MGAENEELEKIAAKKIEELIMTAPELSDCELEQLGAKIFKVSIVKAVAESRV